jgi:endonuclease G
MKLLISFILFVTVALSTEVSDFINIQNCDQIIDKQVYTACYDYDYKGSKFVAYTLDGSLVNKANIKNRQKFYTEKNIPKQYRSHTRDYTHSGYDRGHLASDASFDYDIKALRKTYSMVNIIPQAPQVNRRQWSKAEDYERLVATKLGTVTVVNGVVYSQSPKQIGANKIAVPDGYWKMIYNDEQGFKKCFYYSNDISKSTTKDKLRNHQVECKNLTFK